MNYNQNSNRYNCGFCDKKNGSKIENCFCRHCQSNFPPEINWNCDENYHYHGNSDYDDFNWNERFLGYDYDEEYENTYSRYKNENEERFDRNLNKNKRCNCNRNQNQRPQHNCQKKCFCGFFKIFHC